MFLVRAARFSKLNTTWFTPIETSHQSVPILQLHINIRVLSNPQTLNISSITNALQIMNSSSTKGMLNAKIHAGSIYSPLRELLKKQSQHGSKPNHI